MIVWVMERWDSNYSLIRAVSFLSLAIMKCCTFSFIWQGDYSSVWLARHMFLLLTVMLYLLKSFLRNLGIDWVTTRGQATDACWLKSITILLKHSWWLFSSFLFCHHLASHLAVHPSLCKWKFDILLESLQNSVWQPNTLRQTALKFLDGNQYAEIQVKFVEISNVCSHIWHCLFIFCFHDHLANLLAYIK